MPPPVGVSVGVKIIGAAEAKAALLKVAEGAAVWQRSRVGASSDVPYAYRIEMGRYFGGRKGSGRAYRYMQQALAEIEPMVGPAIGAALSNGGPAVSAAAAKLSQELARRAQGHAPSVSGRLRRSIRPNRGQGLRSMIS